WGRDNIKRGDRVVTTVLEHHSDFVPWQQLATEVGAEIAVVDIDDDGRLRRDQLSAELRKGAKLLAITHTSNGLGTVNPVKEIAAEARAAGATVLVDVAQAVPHTPVDVRDLGADFVAFSGHKMLAPPGSGGLWGRAEILEKMRPGRPPLQPAAHDAARRARDDAREHVSLQHDRRDGCSGARRARGEESVRDLVMDDMYRDYILDHYKNPRNFGELDGATHTYH